MNLKKACLRNSALKDLKILVAIFCGVLSTLLPVRSSDNPNVKIGYRPIKGPAPVPRPTPAIDEIPKGYPADNGVDEAKLIDLAKWIKSNPNLKIYSVLISKNGKLILELYTPGLKRDDNHYMMSITKSILADIVGIAIDKKKIPSETTYLDKLIPEKLFPNNSVKQKFSKFSLKDVLGMQCLDVEDTDDSSNQQYWFGADNRLKYVLTSPTQNPAKKSLKYTQQTTAIASGILSYRTGLSAFDFGQDFLFKPLGFKNAEWCHQDRTGIESGSAGLRLRPIDMHKIGILHLQNGKWNNKQIISQEFVYKTSMPYSRYDPKNPWYSPNDVYAYYWWQYTFGTMLKWQCASGWMGQLLAINRDTNIVVSITGYCGNGEQDKIMKDYVIPAIYPIRKPNRIQNYDEVVKSVNVGNSRIPSDQPYRFTPSTVWKIGGESRVKFTGLDK